MTAEAREFISKGRLDALTDGVFAFAMTLLVINLDLPEDFHPSSAAELISALLDLSGTLIAYVVTFLVLASFWLGRARTREEPESASGGYAWSVLFHLFFVTLLPFFDDCCWPVQPRAGNMPIWSQHGPPGLDGNRHHSRDRARHPPSAGPKRPSRICCVDRFGYSLDGNRLLQPG
jgi:hypothetical protein